MLMTINPAKNDASYNWVNSNPGNQGPFVSGGAAFRTGDCSSERRIKLSTSPLQESSRKWTFVPEAEQGVREAPE
jgi:hypothetical protein